MPNYRWTALNALTTPDPSTEQLVIRSAARLLHQYFTIVDGTDDERVARKIVESCFSFDHKVALWFMWKLNDHDKSALVGKTKAAVRLLWEIGPNV